MLCYDGCFPDSRELYLVNLADINASRTFLKLENLKIISYVQHRVWSDQTKICFLAYDYSDQFKTNRSEVQVVHGILNTDKAF